MAEENEHDPLDALFEGGEDTQSTTAGQGTQTSAQEGPAAGEDTQAAPAGNDVIDDGGGQKMVPKAALDEARLRARDLEARLAEHVKPAGEDTKTASDDGFDLTQIFGDLPDPKEDLEGYLQGIEARRQFNDTNNHLERSERYARKEHGVELVDKVRDWALKKFGEDPLFAQRVIFDADPYEVAIQEYNSFMEAETLKTLPEEVRKGLSDDELELIRQHRASKTASPGDAPSGEALPQPARADDGKFAARRSPAPPAASISGLPAGMKGGNSAIPTGPGSAVDATFG